MQENTCARVFFLIKLTVSGPQIKFKKRLGQGCFSVIFAKFLKVPFFLEELWWLLNEQSNLKQIKSNDKQAKTNEQQAKSNEKRAKSFTSLLPNSLFLNHIIPTIVLIIFLNVLPNFPFTINKTKRSY